MICEVGGLPLPVALIRRRQSRRLRMRIDHSAGLIKLTIPWRASGQRALDWARGQRAWVEAQLDQAPAGVAFVDGATLPLEGHEVTIQHLAGARRGALLDGRDLKVGGPADGLASAVERWLRARARERCSALAGKIAAQAGVVLRNVAVGDAGTRWGSCSSDGSLRFNWRLILAPPDVLRFVVAHEVAHRLHMDHSPAFKAAEEQLYGGPVAPARSELRRIGPALRAIGRR